MQQSRRTAMKVLASVSIVGSAAAVAGLGTFGTFTSTTDAAQTVASGTVQVELGTAGSASNRLTIGAAGLVPGDTVQRAVDLSNTGNQDVSAVSLTTTAAGAASSVLTTDTAHGLQMTVERCSDAWTESVNGPAGGYTCSGDVSSVIASRPVLGSAVAMGNLSLGQGTTNHLRVTLTLPTDADNGFQGKESTVTYAFTALQRSATGQ